MSQTYFKGSVKIDTLTVTNGVTNAGITSTGTMDLQGAVFALDNTETGITAHSGGGQSSAYQLSKVVSIVGTVGTAADSVKLPAPSKVGQIAIVHNGAASNSMQVYGSGTDTINGVATGTGVAQAAGKMAIYVATSTGTAATWFRILGA
jgi:hypothetical protein